MIIVFQLPISNYTNYYNNLHQRKRIQTGTIRRPGMIKLSWTISRANSKRNRNIRKPNLSPFSEDDVI